MAEGDGGVGPRRDVGREAARRARLSTLASGGLEFAGAILIGLFGGQWLDRRLGTGPWLVVVGVFVGAGAGFLGLYRTLMAGAKRPESRGAGRPGGN
jgi:ATP synthase protein I